MKGIVRVDVVLSVGMFILILGVLAVYVRSASVPANQGKYLKTIMLDRMLDGRGISGVKTEAELFFVNSSTGYVNVTINPSIAYNPNATRAYLLPDWDETEAWIIQDSPLKLLINATSESYVIVLSNKSSNLRYQSPPASTKNDSSVIHVSYAKLFDSQKLPLLDSNLSYIRKHVAPFRIEIWKSGTIEAYAGFNLSSFQSIYVVSYPWLCINSTADVYDCTIKVMTW